MKRRERPTRGGSLRLDGRTQSRYVENTTGCPAQAGCWCTESAFFELVGLELERAGVLGHGALNVVGEPANGFRVDLHSDRNLSAGTPELGDDRLGYVTQVPQHPHRVN
jgi:hypothetical protein